eukprot:702247-Rhodomonas_salina.3
MTCWVRLDQMTRAWSRLDQMNGSWSGLCRGGVVYRRALQDRRYILMKLSASALISCQLTRSDLFPCCNAAQRPRSRDQLSQSDLANAAARSRSCALRTRSRALRTPRSCAGASQVQLCYLSTQNLTELRYAPGHNSVITLSLV